jgi:hypothetical protein
MAHTAVAHTAAHGMRRSTERVWRGLPGRNEDPLDPIRGILIGALLAIAGFWLPLAFLLAP